MPTRPRITVRTLNAAHLYDDEKRSRFVVYRRAGGVSRKTSVRYRDDGFRWLAEDIAQGIANRLHTHPADKLASFKFSK